MSEALDEVHTEQDDDYIDETQVYQVMRLRVRLEDIEREMRMLEDPYLRVVASNMNRNSEKESDPDEDPQQALSSCHVLALACTCRELEAVSAYLKKSENTEKHVLFHNNLAKAIRFCKNGDKLLILPGVYVCDTLPWIEKNITVQGLGDKREDVVLEADEAVGDVFLNCGAEEVTISNLSLRTRAETHSILMVHSGVTTVSNCVIDCRKSRNSIMALSKVRVLLQDSQVDEKKIAARPGSSLSIDGKQIHSKADTSEEEPVLMETNDPQASGETAPKVAPTSADSGTDQQNGSRHENNPKSDHLK
jgi:hypothetical protein